MTRVRRDRIREALALAACGLCCLSAPGTANADTQISDDRTARQLTAFNGRLMWVRDVPAGNQRLVEADSGGPSDLDVASAASFDGLDLGTDSRGRMIAVYSRCPRSRGAFRSCDIFRYAFATRREQRMRTVSSARCDEVLPSVSRGRVVFVRRARRTGNRGRCREGVFLHRPGQPPRRLSRRVPLSVDHAGGLVVAAFVEFLPRSQSGGTLVPKNRTVEVRRTRGRWRRLAFEGGPFKGLDNTVIDSGFAYWTVTSPQIGSPGQPAPDTIRIQRRRLAGGARQAGNRQVQADSLAVDRGVVFYAQNDAAAGPTGVFRADTPPLRFEAR